MCKTSVISILGAVGKVSVGHTVMEECKSHLSVLWSRNSGRALALGVFPGFYEDMDSTHTWSGRLDLLYFKIL